MWAAIFKHSVKKKKNLRESDTGLTSGSKRSKQHSCQCISLPASNSRAVLGCTMCCLQGSYSYQMVPWQIIYNNLLFFSMEMNGKQRIVIMDNIILILLLKLNDDSLLEYGGRLWFCNYVLLNDPKVNRAKFVFL
jgi:hypothetical protein